jgi:hypothetical protein
MNMSYLALTVDPLPPFLQRLKKDCGHKSQECHDPNDRTILEISLGQHGCISSGNGCHGVPREGKPSFPLTLANAEDFSAVSLGESSGVLPLHPEAC